jgi:hypothetical protein
VFVDSFGFLPECVTLEFGAGRLRPVSEHAALLQELKAATNRDGFLYPPTQVTKQRAIGDPDAEYVEIPGSQRPAPIFRLPASHEIEIDTPVVADSRAGDAGFVMHLVAALYGYRLQFHDWWLDGRIPISESTHHVYIDPSVASRFLTVAFKTWMSETDAQRKALTNIAYMHARAGCYEWDWESFIIEYMVLDAVYAFASTAGKVKKDLPHGARIDGLCKAFGLWRDDSTIERIVDLRNELFHEALWDGTHPGQSHSDQGRLHMIYLRCLNHRLIPAILGWKGEYVSTRWTQWRGKYVFE